MTMADPKDEELTRTLTFDEHTSVTVHLHGATVTHWRYKGNEQLFLSKHAVFDNKKAIRGGIPIVFPNFGAWDRGPQHGFARTSTWSVLTEPAKQDDDSVVAVLSLKDTDESRKIWPFKFCLKYKLTLKAESFCMDFRVRNIGSESFEFTCLLHTYLRVPHISRIGILGLKGLDYIEKAGEKVKDGEECNVEEREIVRIPDGCLVDRIYKDTPTEHCLIDGNITMKLVKSREFPDTVVWNPGKVKAAEMSDFGNEEYLEMVCIEAGCVANPYKLGPGKQFKASQMFLV